jgi:predicted glycoside hydrolase/deacetylase ChbG (UPF0249 family)
MPKDFPPHRPLIVCADDYGIAPAVDAAIRELIADRRLSATSCMSAMPGWRAAAGALQQITRRAAADVGLHLILTDQAPASRGVALAHDGRLPPLSRLLPRALARRLPTAAVRDELRAQLDAFEDAWGAPPDHLDGHQHVHLLPGVRDLVVDEILRRYPLGRVWVRDCVEAPRRCLRRGVSVGKALFIAALGAGLRRRLRAADIPANEGFSGLHDFSLASPFRARMQRFLAEVGPRPLVHVHPGRVDAALVACDALTAPREAELTYLASPAFADDLREAGLYPARYADFAPPAGAPAASRDAT